VQSAAIAETAAPAARASGAAAAQDTEERFLRLLVAQMRNQDPLNPLDNAQVTAQIAQISTVRGIERLNATLAALAASMALARWIEAAALVGREALVEADALAWTGESLRAGFALAGRADLVTVEIRDAAGVLVDRRELGAREAGVHVFAWDGRDAAGAPVAPGRYRLAVSARRGSEAVEATALVAARVAAVAREGETVVIELTGLGRRELAAVRQIL